MNERKIYNTKLNTGPVYMTNLRHPAVRELYKEWCKENGIMPSMPPSDEERIRFEISIFKTETVKKLENYADWVEAEKERVGPELLEHIRKTPQGLV